MKRRLKERLGDVLESWGLSWSSLSQPTRGKAVQVYWPAVSGDRAFVGELAFDEENHEYVFRYDADYASRDDLPAIPSFPERRREYRSKLIWPFFTTRLPPLDREDAKNAIRTRGIDSSDEFQVIGELGRRALTTPFEFHYTNRPKLSKQAA